MKAEGLRVLGLGGVLLAFSVKCLGLEFRFKSLKLGFTV